MRARFRAPTVCAALLLAACAGAGADRDSAEYQAGYHDGCTTGGARASHLMQEPQRDNDLYQKSGDYRAGWASGYNVCGGRDNPGRF